MIPNIKAKKEGDVYTLYDEAGHCYGGKYPTKERADEAIVDWNAYYSRED